MKNKLLIKTLCLILILPFFCLFGCNEDKKYYEIVVQSSDITKGTVTGTNIYKGGYNINLNASPIGENTFIAWVKNGYIISYEKDYSFKASQNTQGTYIALFKSDTLDFFTMKKAVYNVTGIELQNTADALLKITSFDVDMSLSQSLFTNLTDFSDKQLTTDTNFYNDTFNIVERMFYADKKYYFKTKLVLEYNNPTTLISTFADVETNFMVDFNKLNTDGVLESGILTYTCEDYTIQQSHTSAGYLIVLKIDCLNNPQTWTENTAQQFVMQFTYPFNLDIINDDTNTPENHDAPDNPV